MDAAEYNRMVAIVRRVRHDASSPLTAALGSVQLLLGDPSFTDPENREIAAEVEHELRRLADVLRGLSAIQPVPEPAGGDDAA